MEFRATWILPERQTSKHSKRAQFGHLLFVYLNVRFARIVLH
jgi:hypothetical protein